MRHRFVSVVSLVGVVLLGAAGGCASDKQVIAQANDVHTQLEPAVYTDPVLDQYVQSIGDRIVESAREASREGFGPDAHRSEDSGWMFEGVEFHLVASDTLNAFTTGGKHAYMYTELMLACETEDEFAAVAAHEFGHIYGRHVHDGMNRQYAMLGAAAGAAVAGYALGGDDAEQWAAIAGGTTLVGGQFIGLGFGRDDEYEADMLGFEFYTRSGYDPSQFAGFFREMIDRGYDTSSEMTSSHPSLSNRVSRIERFVDELPPHAKEWRRPPIADQARFVELQDRARQLLAEMQKDQTLAQARLLFNAFPSCVAPVPQKDQTEARELIRDTYVESNESAARGR